MPPTDNDIEDVPELDAGDPLDLVEDLRDSLDELSDRMQDLHDTLVAERADKATFHVEGPPELVTSVLDRLKGGTTSQLQTMLGTIAPAILADGSHSRMPAPETSTPKRPRTTIHLVFDSAPLGERGTTYSGEIAVVPIDGSPALFASTFNGSDPDRPEPTPEPPPTEPAGEDEDDGELPD